MKTICLSFDDFSIENTNLFYLEKLREIYPKIKLSMFYVPADRLYFNRLDDEQKKLSLNAIRIAVAEKWLELIPHGLTHFPREFEHASYEFMKLAINAYDEHFKVIDCPYIRGFKAPFWLISKGAVKCLNDSGWFLALDRNQPDSIRGNINYIYNWSIDEPFPNDKDIVKGHGHINFPEKNNLVSCLKNLSKIPKDYKWKFVSEIVKQENENYKF